MPYRLNPTNPRELQIKKGGKWITKKVYATAGLARKRLKALKRKEKESAA